jgi:hypothetical protein
MDVYYDSSRGQRVRAGRILSLSLNNLLDDKDKVICEKKNITVYSTPCVNSDAGGPALRAPTAHQRKRPQRRSIQAIVDSRRQSLTLRPTYSIMQRTMRTPDKNMSFHSSDPNIVMSREKTTCDETWISHRQKKKRMEEGPDDFSDCGIEMRRQKMSCCNTDVINDTLLAFGKQMETMNKTLNTMKEEQNTRFSTMHKDITKIKNQMSDIKNANSEIEKEIDFLGEKYVELQKAREEISENSKKQENRIKDVLQKNTYLEKCNKALEERVMRLEQKELAMQIELMNVQKKEGEDLMATVSKIAQELSLRIQDIENVWRVPGDLKDARPVIVSLRSREARTEWLKCRKRVLTNGTIYNTEDSSRIFINEHLTRQLRHLFWSAKNRLRETHKFVWIRNGKVLVKKNENEKRVYQINFESDIDSLFIEEDKKAE